IKNKARGIKYNNFINKLTAKIIAEKGCFLTLTLVIYAKIVLLKWKEYLPLKSILKNKAVL
ncbi:hypothetical protein F5883DRAFT_436139, partial [Diaporthe sp. PMI_573]